MTHEWLENSENQEMLYEMCEQAMTELAPDEVPLFEELFPPYIEMAQQGEVVTGGSAHGPFSLSGGEDLVAFVVIPIMIDIVASILAASGATAIRAILSRGTNKEALTEEQIVSSTEWLRQIVSKQLAADQTLSAEQVEIVEVFTQAVLNVLVSLVANTEETSDGKQSDS